MDKAKFFPATAMPDHDWWSALWPDPESVLRSLGIESGMTVVDLCCGDGYFTAPLARVVESKVYGLDIDPAMLARCRAGLDRAGLTVRALICADARDLSSVLPAKVDYVLMANTFHGVPDQAELSRAVAAVLRPAGRFAVVNWHPLPREKTVVLDKPRGPGTDLRMSPEAVRLVVEPTGFALDRIVDLPPFHYGAVFRRTARQA
jgi:SAM-dependent methyltransferase